MDSSVKKNLEKDYREMFRMAGLDPDKFVHEWNKEGDLIKEYSLFEEQPTPILTTDTYPVK